MKNRRHASPPAALPGPEPRSAGLRPGDVLALGKPMITAASVAVTGGTFLLATRGQDAAWGLLALTLLGTALLVLGACGLNMVWERDSDARMERTRHRPVAAGRLSVAGATTIAGIQSAAGLALLLFGANGLTAAIAAAALLVYVAVYTPLKSRSRYAALVGTLPGAAPALLGPAAALGNLDAGAYGVFAVLVVWQLPHALAIDLYRREDQQAAGARTASTVLGSEPTRLRAFAWTMVLFCISLALVPLGVAGFVYFLIASLAGGGLVVLGVAGLEPGAGRAWARRYKRASLAYLPLLSAALILDTWVR
jgi:protoheme IX farnesyltransferase